VTSSDVQTLVEGGSITFTMNFVSVSPSPSPTPTPTPTPTQGSYTIVDLGAFQGDNYIEARSINATGEVLGYHNAGQGLLTARAFLYRDGALQDLGTLGGPSSVATGINDSGIVVGGAQLPNGEFRAFVFENGVLRDLGTLGENFSYAWAVNNSGDIVGESGNGGSFTPAE
jgi:probable HAF family extracellular repeat protein